MKTFIFIFTLASTSNQIIADEYPALVLERLQTHIGSLMTGESFTKNQFSNLKSNLTNEGTAFNGINIKISDSQYGNHILVKDMVVSFDKPQQLSDLVLSSLFGDKTIKQKKSIGCDLYQATSFLSLENDNVIVTSLGLNFQVTKKVSTSLLSCSEGTRIEHTIRLIN